jgi:DAK2 domain fusion protein YloV
MASGAPALETLDGEGLRRLLGGAAAWLERNAAAVDALNVFPVPDGDTGTNMLLTMRATAEAARKAKGNDAGVVMKAAARGAMMGARGNSGVILSQILAGMARRMADHPTCDGPLLGAALAEGADSAYRAVSRPVEGTILTVAREAGGAAGAAAPPTLEHVLARAVAAAQDAVAHTPDLLPILRQAKVVDAGGEGYRVILEGMAFALAGEALPETGSTPAPAGGAARAAVGAMGAVGPAAVAPEEWGYCTQFAIHGEGLDVERLRQELQDVSDSALVVGDDSLVIVHGHTEDPGALLSFATRHGRLQRVSVQDMDAQHDAWLRAQVERIPPAAAHPPRPGVGPAAGEAHDGALPGAPADALATIAVAPGPGLADVFRSLGSGEVVPGGQTMNPSAHDILQAARRTGAKAVLVLPNNGNVVMAAQQAASLTEESGQRLLVVPTRTVPQGIAAQVAFDAGATPEANAEAMARAAGTVRTVEVTHATRSVTLDGVAVQAGDLLALLDDEVVAATVDPVAAASQALDRAGAGDAEVITVYRGEAPGEAEAQQFVAALRDRYPRAQVDLVFGGQPHYDYLISVE